MDKILNRKELSVTSLRADSLEILNAGLVSIDTKVAVRELLEWDEENKTLCIGEIKTCFSDFERIFVVAIGKCAVAASEALEELLGDNITGGIVLDVASGNFKKLSSKVGTHPLPSETNVNATNEIISLLEGATERDLVLAVVSGGGSALLSSPYKTDYGVLAQITSALMKAGANIYELNTVRKHLSNVQGGGLAKIAYPARIIGLIFSDVIGNDISMIASGPLSKDSTTTAEAVAILEKYGVLEVCSLPDCELIETPKEEKFFQNVSLFLAVDNNKALEAMRNKAEELGYRAEVRSSALSGEASDVGKALVQEKLDSRQAILFGGETTVTVRASGRGGRNSELALSALEYVGEDKLLISAASDGHDNTDIAGGIADSVTKKKAEEFGLDPKKFIEENNSYEFWIKVGSDIKTGKTGSNVADLILLLSQ